LIKALKYPIVELDYKVQTLILWRLKRDGKMEIWELWYPKAAATGLSFARSKIDGAETLLVHAAPPVLSVLVRDENGELLAEGVDLEATADTPMTRLERQGKRIQRLDIWPQENDIEKIVLLPGGEAGILTYWWNAEDHSEWRWRVEFYNQR
jgi:hypothetical protein